MSEYVDAIIANALERTNQATSDARDAAQDLLNTRAGFFYTSPNPALGFAITAVEPDVPEVADNYQRYEAERDRLIDLLSNKLADFFREYYPLTNDAYDDAVAWLVDTITNGGTGLNATIEAQIWQRARDRVITEGRRLNNQIVTGYAAKGHSLPQGSMLRKIEDARSDGYRNLSTASTDIAIKQVEIEIETIKFAITKAMEMRQIAIGAAVDYIRALASLAPDAARIAELTSDAKAKMMAATADMYRARMSRDELVLRSKITELATATEIYRHKGDMSIRSDTVDVQAVASAAEVYGRTASAALSALNSIASASSTEFS